MNKDLNKGITEIQYNSLNLPKLMVINSSSVKAKNYYTYSASGVKLRTEQRYDPTLSVAPVGATTPANDGLSNYYTNKDYVGNIIYETEKKGTTITNKTKILVDGGYIENGTYYFYLTDHLGNNRVVANASGASEQSTHYYPFGTSFVNASGTHPYQYNGKELDQMHGLNLYDYSARYYESAIGRFTTVDPLAEKYYSISPYVYVGNNPIIRTDPTGMDWYFFDEDDEGKYSHKREQEGKHRMVMRSKDKEGNIKFTFYDFADPENDPSDIENGWIDRAELVNESDVRGMMEGQGGFDMSNSSIKNFMNKSFGGKSFDYSSGGALKNYMAGKGRENKYTTSLYIPVGDTYAHNFMNFGNFLWGATGYTLGYSQNILLKAADLNSRFDPGRGNGYPGEPDSADDQLSISRGTEYAKKNLYRHRTNPSWLGKLLNVFR